MRLSVLDQSPIVTGRSPDESIRESLTLARHCEAMGYYRYWLAEHHGSAAQAGTAPEILIAAIAATTRRIRVGSAGVMLPHYASLKVAEQFRVLEAIAPGRIDLGLGRAPGAESRTALALNPNAMAAGDLFPSQVRDVLAWLSGEKLVEGHPFRDVVAEPRGASVPEVWILGSSNFGAQVAAYFGLPYCFAHFITDGRGTSEALDLYRETYRPSARHPSPHAAVAVWALAAETDEAASHHFASRAVSRLNRDRGVFLPLPSPEETRAMGFNEADKARLDRIRETSIFGTSDHVVSKLRGMSFGYGVDEVAVLTATHDAEARRRSYTLIAEAMRRADGGSETANVAAAAE